MKLKKLLFLFVSLFILSNSASSTSATFTISPDKENLVWKSYDEDKCKVTFKDASGNVEDIIYVDSGYNISLGDIATKAVSISGIYDYTADVADGSGETSLSEYGSITQDVIFTKNSSVESASSSIDGTTSFTENNSTHLTSSLPNHITEEIELTSVQYSGTITSAVSTINEDRVTSSDSIRNTGYSYSAYAEVSYAGAINYRATSYSSSSLLRKYSYSRTTNQFIGLTTDISKDTAYATASTRYDGDYKNYKYTISDYASRNYCVYRFVLQNDVYISGNFTVAGITGFGWGASDYSNMIGPQGTIVGPYCEIDLNGHSLIVGDGAMLDLWGSITDSKFGTEDAGSLVLLSGSTLYTPMVIEDAYSEGSYAVAYFNNSAFFNSYRCPYLNVRTIIYNGANFYGKYRVDLGSSNSNVGSGDFRLFGGSGTGALFEFKSNSSSDAYIIRDVSYLDWGSSVFTDAAKADLMHQKTSYSFMNADITFNSLTFSLSLSSISMSGTSEKYPFVIPSYFDINLYNSSLEVNQLLFFMPGSSLMVDQNSTMTFGALTHKYMSRVSYGYTASSAMEYQAVGGMIFFQNFYSYEQVERYATRGGTGDSDHNWGGDTSIIWMDNSTYYTELNNHPAYANIYGTIEFDTTAPDSYGIDHDFMFGGQINFSESALETFKTNVNAINGSNTTRNDGHVYLNGEGWLMAECRLQYTWYSGFDLYSNPWAFFTEPLISNGYVLTDPTNPFEFADSDTQYTYDKETGLVYDTENDSYYAYFFNNNENDNFYRAYDSISSSSVNGLTIEDDLNGSYSEVKVNADHTINKVNDTQMYIFFQGYFTPVTVSSGSITGNIVKLLGENTSESGTEFPFTYNTSTSRWLTTATINANYTNAGS